jgi:putative hemolysin
MAMSKSLARHQLAAKSANRGLGTSLRQKVRTGGSAKKCEQGLGKKCEQWSSAKSANRGAEKSANRGAAKNAASWCRTREWIFWQCYFVKIDTA